MARFFAELGRHPALSIAELVAHGRRTGNPVAIEALAEGMALLSGELPGDFAQALGGTVRFGGVLETHGGTPTQGAVIAAVTQAAGARMAAGKTTFGLSAAALGPGVALPTPAKLRAWGLSVKKALKERGSVRLITGSGRLLSPVAVAKNGLIEAGGDFLLLLERGRWHLARTAFVHDFEGQARREFERPVPNPRSGMLPVQLARVMVNLSGRHGTLLDPFCGSGTVLGEALLLGWERIIGSDVSVEEVEASRANLAWLATTTGTTRAPELLVSPVEEIGRRLPRASVDAVVTEPFLGPPQRSAPDRAMAERIAVELRQLYKLALVECSFLLKKGGRVVMVFPRFVSARIGTTLPDADLATMGYRRLAPLPGPLLARFPGGLTKEKNLLYARSDAKVAREIVVLEKQ